LFLQTADCLIITFSECVRLMMCIANTFRRTVIDKMRRDGFETRLYHSLINNRKN